MQTASFLREVHALGVGFVLENPELRLGVVSLFDLPQIVELRGLSGLQITYFDQCTLGGETKKPTSLCYYRVDLSSLTRRCNHEPALQEWHDTRGALVTGVRPHPPLAGRLR
ncbi:MAG: hypothetical protein ACKPKO_61600, partial [Candidatus Fonsibacter sp.]